MTLRLQAAPRRSPTTRSHHPIPLTQGVSAHDHRQSPDPADQRGQPVVVAGAADLLLGLALADQAAGGLDAHDGGVERTDAPEVAQVLLRYEGGHLHPGCEKAQAALIQALEALNGSSTRTPKCTKSATLRVTTVSL